MTTLRCLLVDDELLARQRMARMLGEMLQPRCEVMGTASNAVEAMSILQKQAVDVVFLDIHMPGLSGLDFAQKLSQMDANVAVVFVTAHAEHAVAAFALHATDYLTKPVKAQRLQDCVDRIAAQRPTRATAASSNGNTPPVPGEPLSSVVHVQDPRRSYLLDLRDALILRAELKYVSAITVQGGQAQTHILGESLSEIESKWPELFVRAHRNTLVRRTALQGLVRAPAGAESDEEGSAETWIAQVRDLKEAIPISRRQLPLVRQTLRDRGL